MTSAIQRLFHLSEPSAAVLGSPVLGPTMWRRFRVTTNRLRALRRITRRFIQELRVQVGDVAVNAFGEAVVVADRLGAD